MRFTETTRRRPGIRGLALLLAPSLLMLPKIAAAQTPGVAPPSVLLFPATLSAGTGEGAPSPARPAPADSPAAVPVPGEDARPDGEGATRTPGDGEVAGSSLSPVERQTQEIVTEALRNQLRARGVNVVVYDKRLPSIQRAVAENTLNINDAAGPGNDERTARRLAEIAGASEFVTATIDDYNFDTATRTATFNLSVFRISTADGSTLGTSAAPGKGVAPADVATSRQHGSATSRAAAAAADQAVQNLFPRVTVVEAPKPKAVYNARRDLFVLSIVGAALGLLVLSR